MKRMNKEEDISMDVLKIHHIVEALEDELIRELQKKGIEPDDVHDVLTHGSGKLTPSQAAVVASFSSTHIIHNAIHDIMKHSNLRKIEDLGVRAVVLGHKPRIAKRLSEEELEEYMEEGLGL